MEVSSNKHAHINCHKLSRSPARIMYSMKHEHGRRGWILKDCTAPRRKLQEHSLNLEWVISQYAYRAPPWTKEKWAGNHRDKGTLDSEEKREGGEEVVTSSGGITTASLSSKGSTATVSWTVEGTTEEVSLEASPPKLPFLSYNGPWEAEMSVSL